VCKKGREWLQQYSLSDITFDTWLFSYCQVSDSCGHQPELLQAHTDRNKQTQRHPHPFVRARAC